MSAAAATGRDGGRRRSRPGRERWWATRLAWALLGAVVTLALVFGAMGHSRPSSTARIAYLDSIVKCPACEDLSVAQSDAASAVSLRHRIRAFVDEGWSDGRIETWITKRYGSDTLLLPPTSGASEALYVIPLVGLGVAVLALGWYLWRRRAGPPADAGSGAAA